MDNKMGNLDPDMENVWNYPRPPCVEATEREIYVVFNRVILAKTTHAYRVLETSHPPVYYIPQVDIKMEYLKQNACRSFCEWKGVALYYDVVVGGQKARKAAWYYPDPAAGFELIKGCIAFYAQKMDACYVNGEQVIPQPGDFYGGWITSNIRGPFKGEPGSDGW